MRCNQYHQIMPAFISSNFLQYNSNNKRRTKENNIIFNTSEA